MTLTITRGQAFEYTEGETGEPFFSVSQILNVLDPDAFRFVSKEDLEAAQKRGEELHLLFALLMLSLKGLCDPPKPADHLRGFFNAMVTWADRHLVKPITVEERGRSKKYGHAGTRDLDCRCGSKALLTLVDLKTGEPRRIHKVQLMAYNKLDDVPDYKELRTLYVHEDGTYKFELMTPKLSDWAAFLNAMNILRWRMGT